MLAIANFFALSAPPPLMVALIFVAVYLLVGVPLQFLRGALSRDIWGSLAGIFAGLLYITFVFGIYPDIHDANVHRAVTSGEQLRR
ncbi:hypothetical protein EOS_17165 [Caballeronia mineralivorans PML1(12)]|uniref:Uncharacterized protein n=2 Tax=Burkholderiaceae TaxID=119060 RepID=A0A0J1CXB9_9BURK|nr:hypothetical protein [Caballeronia mineralivorans]KLU25016.1 hypothetical protein EOS_17165 [Caballeronia mineralivorans PML1(12)]